MKQRIISLMIGLLFTGMCWGGGISDESILFIVQEDLLPQVQEKEFEAGFNYLLSQLPPAQRVDVLTFKGDRVRLSMSGPAEEARWPSEKCQFCEPTAETRPFHCLLGIIRALKLNQREVYFISSCVTLDPAARITNSDWAESRSRSQDQLTQKSTGSVMDQFISYCRENELKVVGIYANQFVPVPSLKVADFRDNSYACSTKNMSARDRVLYQESRKNIMPDITEFDVFRDALRQTGSEIHYNYNTYRELFAALLRENMF